MRKRILLLGTVLATAVTLTVLLLFSRAQHHAEQSCVRSVFHALARNPSLLGQVIVPVTNQWYGLDDAHSVVLVNKLLKQGLLDCKGLEQSLAQGRIGELLKVQIIVSEDGSQRFRVIGVGHHQSTNE